MYSGNIFKQQRSHRSWGDIAFDFIAAFRQNIYEAIHERQVRMARMVASIVLLAVGAIFFLVGFSIFLGMMINQTTWAGYLVVGIAMLLIGFMVKK